MGIYAKLTDKQLEAKISLGNKYISKEAKRELSSRIVEPVKKIEKVVEEKPQLKVKKKSFFKKKGKRK